MKKPHNFSIDILRIFSILAVVMIHTTTKTIQFTNANLIATQFSLFLNQASRFAVPLFFMISGFVLELSYHSNVNLLDYFRKRFSRILVPYLFWSAFYLILIYPQPLNRYFSVLFNGGASYQLYFIPTIVIFYLFFPLVNYFYNFLSQKIIILILGLIQICILLADYYFQSISLFNPLAIALFNFFPFLLGVIASHHQESLHFNLGRWKYTLMAGTILLAFTVSWEGYSHYLQNGNYLSFYSQWRPSVLLYSIFFASLFYYIFDHIRISENFVKLLSNLSFFVFFIHIIILEISWKYLFIYIFPKNLIHLFWFDPLFFMFVSFTSFFVAYLCHKIPKTSLITG